MSQSRPPLVLLLSLMPAACERCEPPDGVEVCEGGLVISEVMFNPAATDDTVGEYLEITNVGTSACSLESLVVARTGSDDDFSIGAGVVLAPGEYVVLAAGIPEEGAPYTVDFDWTGLSLTEEAEICIESAAGTTLDCVAYGDEGWPAPWTSR